MAVSDIKEIIPNPDPSTTTLSFIDRSIISATKITDAKLDALNARIDGMEKAVEVFQADLTRVPTQLDRAINGLNDVITQRFVGIDTNLTEVHSSLDRRENDIKSAITHLHDLLSAKVIALSEVMLERFAGVAAQFSERDTRTDQRAGDTKLAVDAAFAAAKEATAKIEAGFTKQIDAMINIIDTKTSNLSGGLSDIKDRITALENRFANIGSQNSDNRNVVSDQRANLALIVSAIGVAVLVALHFIK